MHFKKKGRRPLFKIPLVMALALLLWVTGLAFLSPRAQASPLHYMMQGDVYLYYPRDEQEMAERLMAEIPAMIAFLETKNLPVHTPLHIVLDDELDYPAPEVHMISHREIRLPLRAPGVFEDGFLEPDPWAYFMFRGLSLQGIYAMRSGIPHYLHKGFGELISPNIILPQWITDGIGDLLYSEYKGHHIRDPLDEAILAHTAVPDLDTVSNHPEIWPGHYSYRIYGRPFIRFLNDRYGWEKLHDFLRRHGRGIIPIEIDLKAHDTYGWSWPSLWKMFQFNHAGARAAPSGLNLTGYWPEPFVHWSRSGVTPGVEKRGARGRFGVVGSDRSIWISEYHPDGDTRLVRYAGTQSYWLDEKHIWDPGQGGVAVTRKGSRPQLLLFTDGFGAPQTGLFGKITSGMTAVPAPPGVMQLSGPVRDERGRVAVAGNTEGNWDIWLYENERWHRMTEDPAIQTDPWFRNGDVVYSTNRSGRFRITGFSDNTLSDCDTMALLPRGDRYLCLSANGWAPSHLATSKPPLNSQSESSDRAIGELPLLPSTESTEADKETESTWESRPYTPFKSIWPNYIKPELFISGSSFQVGVGTFGMDVSGDYTVEAGIRYAFEEDFFSARLGATARQVGLRYTRYPLSYATALTPGVDEERHEIKAFWEPWDTGEVEFSANFRSYEDRLTNESPENEGWGALHLSDDYGRHRGWADLELFSDQSRSLYGGGELLFGEHTYTLLHLQAGKTWGTIEPGHNSYRIGGNVVEGYFTQRPSRLFPLRGFSSNILESGQAVTTGMEVFWPLANLQAGYQTLPLFFHRFMLGTFIDAGAASDPITDDDFMVGGGFELVTSFEVAWGNLSSFRMGIAWPLHQPDYLDEKGPVFLIQIGKPL